MTVKRIPAALSAVLISLPLLLSCVKEERRECPCWLTVALDDALRTAPTAGVSLWTAEGPILSESVAPGDYASPADGYERTVPRGYVRTVVTTGADLSSVSAGRLIYTAGSPVDSVWAHTALVDCRDEFATDSARLHRQFARVHLFLEVPPQDGRERSYSIGTGCGGFDLLALAPLEGQWTLPLVMRTDGSTDFIVPRLSDRMRFSLTVSESSPDGDEDDVDLQALLAALGYSWSKEDLDDIWIGLDFVKGTVSVQIAPWEDGGTIIEKI